jgi:hypothetical protein
MDAQCIAHLERLLWLYALPYDPVYPVVCFDERLCFLIGDILAPLPMQRGHGRKEHYADEKNGAWAPLAAIAPVTGKRVARGYARRTKEEDTEFCQASAAT